MTIKRLKDQKSYDVEEYRKNETEKEKDDPYKCMRETEVAQANFTALTKTWPLLSTNQKNFCSQKPFEHGQVWRNYMACVGIKAQKLQPREPEFFVRKMVCQDDNAPEVGSSSTNISLKCLLKVASLHSLLYQPHHNLENYKTTKKSRQNASKTICFSTSKASLFST